MCVDVDSKEEELTNADRFIYAFQCQPHDRSAT